MNNTALRIENGMSSFELLQAKVSSLEATEKCMSIEEDRRMAAIDAMDRTYNNPSTPRRTRFELMICGRRYERGSYFIDR